eukprot:2148136-Prymnesium_polylepis.1
MPNVQGAQLSHTTRDFTRRRHLPTASPPIHEHQPRPTPCCPARCSILTGADAAPPVQLPVCPSNFRSARPICCLAH